MDVHGTSWPAPVRTSTPRLPSQGRPPVGAALAFGLIAHQAPPGP
jgi:hypothetical protein